MVALPSTIGEGRYVTAGGQRIRVNVRQGTGVPLVLCNGIGASLEVLDPLVEQLDLHGGQIRRSRDRRITHIPCPLRVSLPCLGAGPGAVQAGNRRGGRARAVLGRRRLRSSSPSRIRADAGAWCWWRRAPACLWCPPIRGCWRKWLPRAGSRIPTTPHPLPRELYGGTVRAHGEDVARLFVRQLHAGSKIGYLHQLLAGSVWTSMFAPARGAAGDVDRGRAPMTRSFRWSTRAS